MNHTATPWAVRGDYYVVGGSPEFLIADCQADRKDRKQDTVNAEHIVKCVNAHDELVAALKLFANLDTSVSSDLWTINPDYCAQARAALSKLESA